jgi:hypothetical protein
MKRQIEDEMARKAAGASAEEARRLAKLQAEKDR